MIVTRFKFAKIVRLGDSLSKIVLGSKVRLSAGDGAQIIIHPGAILSIGADRLNRKPSLNLSTLCLGKNALIEIFGNVIIEAGTSIQIGENGHIRFKGGNRVGRDNILICKHSVIFGKSASTSWRVTLIDDDGHHFVKCNGVILKPLYRPLVLEDGCGIQASVIIPRGVTVGRNSVISAGTVLRQDVPANAIAYVDSKVKVKEGYMTPYGYEESK